MKKVAIDYKGKHFVITDEDLVNEFDSIDPYVDVERILDSETTLLSYVADCNYYGIPTYHGSDARLKERIASIQTTLDMAE